MKKSLVILLCLVLCNVYAFAGEPLTDSITSADFIDMGKIKTVKKNSAAANLAKEAFMKYKSTQITENEEEVGFGNINLLSASSRSVPSIDELEYELLSGSTPGSYNMALYKIPESYCTEQYPYPKVEPIDGLLMYTTYAYEQNLVNNNIPFTYITQAGFGNVIIQPSVLTEYPEGQENNDNKTDLSRFFKFTNVKPYAIDNNHVYRNNWEFPDNMAQAEWADPSEYAVNNIGCHMVITTEGREVIPGNPYVWLIMMEARDNGDDLFFGSNLKQNVFNSESYANPVWTLFFDQKETTHYVFKIRREDNRSVFRNILDNWLYFTVINNGLTSIQKFNPAN